MKPSKSIPLLAALAAIATMAPGCRSYQRRVIQKVPDPSGRWMAIVDEVEYQDGFLTSVADRVLVVEPASSAADGTVERTLAFSEDAMPDLYKPRVSWSGGRVSISVARDAYVHFQRPRVDGVEIVVSRRP
jgi:hypothetical protein